MYIQGRIWKDDRSSYWLAEIAMFCITAKGLSSDEALDALDDAIRTRFPKFGFTMKYQDKDRGEILLRPNEVAEALGLSISRTRQDNTLTMIELTRRLGFTSKFGIAQYEGAKREASISKLDDVLSVMNRRLVISVVDE